jgi:membrane protease YdiL (CAAX protease family)
MAPEPPTLPDGAGAPGRPWLVVAGAAACAVLYVASSASAYLLLEMGHRTVAAAAVAIVVNIALCAGTIALAARIAYPGGVPAAIVGRARSSRVGIAVLAQVAFVMVALPLLTAIGKALGFHGTTNLPLNHHRAGVVLLVTWIAIVAAPWMEELSMRGFLLSGLWERFGFWPAALASSLVWAGLHGVSGVLIPFTCEGLLLCWIRRRTGSVRTGIALHATQNVVASVYSGAGLLVLPPLAAVTMSLVLARDGSATAARARAARALRRATTTADAAAARLSTPGALPGAWVLAGGAFASGLVLEALPVEFGVGGSGLLTAGRIVIAALTLPPLAWLLLAAGRTWGAPAATSLAGATGCALVVAARGGILLSSSALVPLVGVGYTLVGFGLLGLATGELAPRARAAAGAAGLLMVATLTPLPYVTTTAQAMLDQTLLTSFAAGAALVLVGLTLRRPAPPAPMADRLRGPVKESRIRFASRFARPS